MANQGPKKILLIDDEKSFCELISIALKKEGFEVICFNNAQEALLKIFENLPDLILLDIAMPEINGFELLTYLKKDLGTRCPPICLLTNLKYTDDGRVIDENFAQSIGASCVIYKSEGLNQLIDKINSLLNK